MSVALCCLCARKTHLQTLGVQQGCWGAAYSEHTPEDNLGELWSRHRPAVHSHPATTHTRPNNSRQLKMWGGEPGGGETSCGVRTGLLCIGTLQLHTAHQQQAAKNVGWNETGGEGGGAAVHRHPATTHGLSPAGS